MPPRKLNEKNRVAIITASIACVGVIIAAFIAIIPEITRSKEAQKVTEVPLELIDIETIRFDYSDSPTNHGWNLIEGDANKIVFEAINDATVGEALKIETSYDNFYAIDYDRLSPQASEFGNYLEIVAKYPDQSSSIYAFVSLIDENGEPSSGWLNFKIGKDRELPSQKMNVEQEWLVFVDPASFLDQNWVLIRIDLDKTVQDTFGKDGWALQSLSKFRVRGNLWIDYIKISSVTTN